MDEVDYDLRGALEVSTHTSGTVGGAPVEPKVWLGGFWGRDEGEPTDLDLKTLAFWNEDWEGEHLWLIEVSDGRFLYISASHDYTGWDCQAGGIVVYYDSRESLLASLTRDERERLGV